MERQPWVHPVLRWAGSKRKLVPRLVELVPTTYSRYVEPFAGSACLFFALRPDCAILGDINADLMSSLAMIKRHPRLMARHASELGTARRDYYRIRSKFQTETDPLMRAVYFVYLNRYCFNGVYRTNKQGQFNVPFGTKTGSLPDQAHFYRCSVALRAATLLTADFRETLQQVERNDFVYLDPPYSSCDRPRYGEYGYGSFQPVDLDELVAALNTVTRRGATFLLSYWAGKVAREAFSAYYVREVTVRRHVAGFAGHRRRVRELLVTNCRS